MWSRALRRLRPANWWRRGGCVARGAARRPTSTPTSRRRASSSRTSTPPTTRRRRRPSATAPAPSSTAAPTAAGWSPPGWATFAESSALRLRSAKKNTNQNGYVTQQHLYDPIRGRLSRNIGEMGYYYHYYYYYYYHYFGSLPAGEGDEAAEAWPALRWRAPPAAPRCVGRCRTPVGDGEWLPPDGFGDGNRPPPPPLGERSDSSSWTATTTTTTTTTGELRMRIEQHQCQLGWHFSQVQLAGKLELVTRCTKLDNDP